MLCSLGGFFFFLGGCKRGKRGGAGGRYRQIKKANQVQDVIKLSPTSTKLGLNCPTYGSVTQPKPKYLMSHEGKYNFLPMN